MRKQQQNKNQAPHVGGINVHYDTKGRPVYFEPFTKTAYLLEDVESRYQFYRGRFGVGVAGGVLAYVFNVPIVICIIIGLVVYVIMEAQFRRFLKSLTVLPNFVPAKRPSALANEAKLDTNRLVLKTVLFVILAVLIIWNAIDQQYTGLVLIINDVIAAAAFLAAIFEGAALFKKLR